MKISSKTSGVSLHFKKHKANDSGINNLQRHNERQPGDKYKRMNKKIDPDRTHENIIIKKAEKTFYMDAKNKIKEHRKNGLKGVRKDAVRLVEGTVQLSGQVLDRDESEQERVLMESYEWLKERFGEENIISAVIHKDETHMHLHFDFVPIKDGELNAKKIIDATKLHEYQETFLEYLQEKEKSMNFIRIKGEHNGLPQDVYEKLQEEREEMLKEIEEERQEMLEDISKQQQELDRRKMDLDRRESSLEAHTAIFKAKVEEFDLKAKNERNRASEREQNLEMKQENLENRELLLLAMIEKLEEERNEMRIDTDIKVKSEDGQEAEVSCHSVKELEHIMELENIDKCNVKTVWMGQEVTNRPMTKEEVKEWADMTSQDLDAGLESLKEFQAQNTPTL